MISRLTSDQNPRNRVITTAFSVLLLLTFVVGCAPQPAAPVAPTAEEAVAAPSEPKAGGTLYIGQDFGPSTLDPHKNIAWASINIYESIYNGLVKWNEDETKLVPDLATSWEISDDGLLYTFKIRQGVQFHNGREMTAEDVKFSLDRLRDPDVSAYAANYKAVEAVEVIDAETVQLTLSTPVGTLLNYLTDRYSIIPPEAVETLETAPVGTGPFKFDEYVLDQYVRLVKNPDYYEEGLPYLDAVEFKILGDEASKEAAVRSQSVDMAWFRDPRQAEAIAADIPGLVSAPGIPSRHIYIRLNMCEEPFNDVNVRRAFSVAMDRQALVNTVIPPQYGGSVSGIIEPSSPFFWTDNEHPYYTHSVDEAKSLLSEAGYPDGITIDAYKVVAANQLDVDAAQVLEQQWAESGINVTIQPMEVGQILADWNAATGTMIQVGITWEPDPDNRLYNVFHSSSAVAQAFCLNDPELDDLLDRGRASNDRAERLEIYQAAQDRIADQAYVLVLYGYPLRWETWAGYVEGYHNVPSNSRWSLRTTWLNK